MGLRLSLGLCKAPHRSCFYPARSQITVVKRTHTPRICSEGVHLSLSFSFFLTSPSHRPHQAQECDYSQNTFCLALHSPPPQSTKVLKGELLPQRAWDLTAWPSFSSHPNRLHCLILNTTDFDIEYHTFWYWIPQVLILNTTDFTIKTHRFATKSTPNISGLSNPKETGP